jgi:hypothetical protein
MLFGTLLYVPDSSQFPIAPIAQFLTVTGGTGALHYYHGTLTGVELSNALDGTSRHQAPGHSTRCLNPGSFSCWRGLASLLAWRKRAILFR